MKKILLAGMIAALLVGSASLGFAGVYGSYTSGRGVAHSPHNMPSYLVKAGQSPTTSQICIFCHTPHNATTSGEAGYNPLWNHKMDTASEFIPYEGMDMNDPGYGDGTAETTFNGLVGFGAGYDVVKGPSRLCMSCHDGNSAIDAYTQNGPGSYYPPQEGNSGSPIIAGELSKLAGPARPASFYFGTATKDLRNDHPIGFDYNDVEKGLNGITEDPNIRDAAVPIVGAVIPATHTSIPKIESILYKGNTLTCASCHDVHNTNGTVVAGGSFAKPFLRVNNEGSNLCLMCHIK